MAKKQEKQVAKSEQVVEPTVEVTQDNPVNEGKLVDETPKLEVQNTEAIVESEIQETEEDLESPANDIVAKDNETENITVETVESEPVIELPKVDYSGDKNKFVEDIITFMTAMEQRIAPEPDVTPSIKEIRLRKELALEELRETKDALVVISNDISNRLNAGNTSFYGVNDNVDAFTELLDGFVDQIVILAGTGACYGTLELHNLFNDVLSAYSIGTDRIGIEPNNKNFFFQIDNWFNDVEQLINMFYEESLEQALRFPLTESLINNNFKNSRFYIGSILIKILEAMSKLGVGNKYLLWELWAEVQRSNMSKLDENGKPIKLPNGKVTKSKLYTKPDLKTIILRYA